MVEDNPLQDELLVEGEGFESTVIRSRGRPKKRRLSHYDQQASSRHFSPLLDLGILLLCGGQADG